MTILTAGSRMSVADKRIDRLAVHRRTRCQHIVAWDRSIDRRLTYWRLGRAAISAARLTCRRRRRSRDRVVTLLPFWTEGAP